MSRTPTQAGTGGAGSAGAGGAAPQPRPAAYPKQVKLAAPAAAAPAAQPSTASTPPGGAQRTAAGATPPPAGKSVSGPPANLGRPDPFSKRNLVLGGSVGGALVLLAIALLVWRPWSPPPPRLNEHPAKIAKFATSPALDKVPFSQQREYMDILDDKEDAVVDAYAKGTLDDQEYRRALQLGWYGKHLGRMDKFFNRPPGLRIMYIDEKVLGKKLKKKNPAAAAAMSGKPRKDDEEKSDDLSPLKPEEIERDDSTEEQDIKKWPPEVQQKWAEYRAVLANRKAFFKDLERKEKERRKAAEASAGTTGAADETQNVETSD